MSLCKVSALAQLSCPIEYVPTGQVTKIEIVNFDDIVSYEFDEAANQLTSIELKSGANWQNMDFIKFTGDANTSVQTVGTTGRMCVHSVSWQNNMSIWEHEVIPVTQLMYAKLAFRVTIISGDVLYFGIDRGMRCVNADFASGKDFKTDESTYTFTFEGTSFYNTIYDGL